MSKISEQIMTPKLATLALAEVAGSKDSLEEAISKIPREKTHA